MGTKTVVKERRELVFGLYKKVMNGDATSKRELIDLHKKVFPRSTLHKFIHERETIHIMYLHLSK